MKKATRVLSLSLATLLLAACGGGGSGIPITGNQHAALGNAVDALMLDYMTRNNIPGATVAVTKNGHLVFWKGYGWADVNAKVRMQPWHRTRIGSVSKLFTAVAALQLVEDGVLDLEDPLYASNIGVFFNDQGNPGFIFTTDGALDNAGEYLSALGEAPKRLGSQPPPPPQNMPPFLYPPAYMNQGSYQANVQMLFDWASQIQIQHVMTHTAGFLGSGSVPKTQQYWQGKGVSLSANPPYPRIHAAMLAGVHDYPLLFSPGSRRRYSNHGYGVLGQVVEDRGGMPYADYMQQRVFAPLGLNDIVPANVLSSKDAVSYTRDGNGNWVPVPVSKMTAPVPGLATGGWAANAGDLARIVCAIGGDSDTARLLSPETADQMTKSVVFSSTYLGWDGRRTGSMTNRQYLTKGGLTPARGGSARVSYYDASSEIIVAVAFNYGFQIELPNGTVVTPTPSRTLLDSIAAQVDDRVSLFSTFDLFPPESLCVSRMGLTAPPPDSGRPAPDVPLGAGDLAIPPRRG